MVQTGDPSGTGKGGTSIWGKKFDDEFHETLKVSTLYNSLLNTGSPPPIYKALVTRHSCILPQHNARGVVSMASSGPDTNGSQFFIIYSKQPHLDLKYTVLGK